MELDATLCQLKGIGEKRAQLFAKLGVLTIYDLLHLYPRTYEDWSHPCAIQDAPREEPCCVRVTVTQEMEAIHTRTGLVLYKGSATDGRTALEITIFNSSYQAQKLHVGEEYYLYGKIEPGIGIARMNTPQIAPITQEPSLRPVYPQTKGLNSATIAKAIRQALTQVQDTYPDCLPDRLRQQYHLCAIGYALENIHFPSSSDALALARKRLIFEELLLLQLGMMRLKHRSREATAARLEQDRTEEFLNLLPFAPTNAQRRAMAEACEDMRSGIPMNRLLQGDVGSGKTAVAAALVYNIVRSGMQCAVMAPTEILAEQHYRTFSNLLRGTDIRVELVTGSLRAKDKRETRERLESGVCQVAIGTHALISENIHFQNLGLVITDEQHRFGVAQRMVLAHKGVNPHLYVMSATPIPRTLSLIIYGDLDVSILDERPPGRRDVATYSVPSALHSRIYRLLRNTVQTGGQAYIVCPLAEQSDGSALLSAAEYAGELQNGPLKTCRIGLLYGKMKPADKDQVMRRFAAGEIDILVSTTVIEVGVDVPNACVMVIENAENFGLPQLHQLRGRVGRGQRESMCILVSDAKGETAMRRLNVMCETTDGFKIAQEDLKLRGPGDFFGSRQHGLPNLRIADMMRDMDILKQAREAALLWNQYDPELRRVSSRELRREVLRLFENVEGGLN